MVGATVLVNFCNELLKINEISDYCPNGLQVQGREEVFKVATAVTASLFVIEQAVEAKADVLLVHHGFFWKNEALAITNQKYNRIKCLIKNDINLVAYHLPLDMHASLGNNAQLANKLNIESVSCSEVPKKKGLFWTGEFKTALTTAELSNLIEAKLNRKPLVLNQKTKKIKKIGWCTGAAQNMIEDAINTGCDAFISGEVSENTYHTANEADIVYFGAGHHATERYGVIALGEYIAKKYNLKHVFIDENNPV